MRSIVAVLLLAVVSMGCGGPACDDPDIEAGGVSTCADTGAPTGYCQCFMREVMKTYTCHQIEQSDVPLSAITEACNECAPQYGGTCS